MSSATAPWNRIPRLFEFILRDPAHGVLRLGLMESVYQQHSPWHTHTKVQGLVVLQGSITVEFSDHPDVTLTPMDAIMIPAGTSHRAMAVGAEPRMVGVEMRLTPVPANDLYRHIGSGERPRTWRCHRPTLLRSLAELRRLAEQPHIVAGPALARAGWGLCVEQPAARNTDAPASESVAPVKPSDAAIDRRVLYVERQMRNFPTTPFDPEVLAGNISVSASQMNRLFNRYRGKSPLRRYQEIRLQLAMEHLTYSTLSIKEIADRCGFAGADHFARRFRQAMGMSPREYRTQHQPSAS